MIYQVGHRLRLTRNLDIFNLGQFPEGSTGTIVFADYGAPRGTPVLGLLMDDLFPGLRINDNVLQIFRSGDYSSNVRTREFEPCGF